jgi:hypothetical protein
MSHNVDKN